ncbi:11169_t:CDS:2 [Acaulospora morrowiae]|uniref:11169_t:CDS:1 n=1 Tax=Acaulospora morrowiae TaxID=94023 RepID=A0A9N9G0L9_9GLOM|nr:11169_t:CDS:2 [Acaulospora morrowiae]
MYIDAGDHECFDSYFCAECIRRFFQEQPSRWTSGNSEIDKIIRKSQESLFAIKEPLEWIPFEQFHNVKKIDEGAFSTVYSANWRDGPLFRKDLPKKVFLKIITASFILLYLLYTGYFFSTIWLFCVCYLWLKKTEKRHRTFHREGMIKVILKKLKRSQDISVEFINELRVYHKLYCKDMRLRVVRLFGISKNPTDGEFIMVLEYCEHGNMRQYLESNSNCQNLRFIHNNLHSGNLLFTKFSFSSVPIMKIADK